ncbi:uncharacterized protein LOC119599085 [Penaeus monodon]|uniref:uncharacterized protein LOC119599085 n=1 Tax=Penaeus monodon TaxID=6687 RepID=UPI0018A70765|nr:uncharacterized protein LOC119599085 [Penaeus monodon]
MKLRLKLLLSFALSLLPLCSTQECKSHRLRGVRIQLASGPRNITVSLEKNHQLDVTLGDKNRKSFTNEGRKCHTINIKEKESKFCVASPTLPFEETCGDGGDALFLLSSMTATWTLDCPPDFSARIGSCSGELHPQRLQAVLLGSDSEYFAFKWRPNLRDTSILPSWENFGQTFRGHNPSGWNDISVSRDVSGE